MPLERGADPRKIKRRFKLNPEPILLDKWSRQCAIEELFLLGYKSTERGGQLVVWLPASTPIAQERDLDDPTELAKFIHPREIDPDYFRQKTYRLSLGGGRARVFVDIYCITLISKDKGLMAVDVTSPYPQEEPIGFYPGSYDPAAILRNLSRQQARQS